jgi:hypothetical protein
MALFGVDVHPVFQAGLPIEQLPAAGIDYLSVKVSQGTDSSYLTQGSLAWIRRGKAAGLICLAYHYLVPGNEENQAKVFTAALKTTGVPGVLDAEAIDKNRNPTLTVAGITAFLTACRAAGAHIPLLYYPRWYWEKMKKPSLAGTGCVLWASSYPTIRVGSPSELFPEVTPDRWQAYAGLPVGLLQFSDTGRVAGRSPVDLNAFLGSRPAFATLIAPPTVLSGTRHREPPMTYRLDPTPIPTGTTPDTVPTGDWETVEHTITAPGPAGGWAGRILQHLTFGYRGGFIQEAWSAPSGRHYVNRYDPEKKTGGRYVPGFDTQSWELPPGDRALIVRCATRANGSVTPEIER